MTLKIDNTVSKTIETMRFPLMCLVFLIHGQLNKTSMGGVIFEYNLSNVPFYANLRLLISDLIATIAVPLFFLISGYLFFIGVKSFSLKVYRNKIKKRIKTLFAPYMIWNIIYIIFFLMAQIFFSNYMSGSNKLILDYTIKDWIRAFYDGCDGYPMCVPFWYVRDLMVVILLSPLLFFLIKKINYLSLLLFGICWLFENKTIINGFSFTSVFFFTTGAFLQINNINIKEVVTKVDKLALILTVVITLIILIHYNLIYEAKNTIVYHYMHKLFVIGSCLVWSSLFFKGVTLKQWRPNPTLNSSLFFVYGFHYLPLIFLDKLLVQIFMPNSETAVIAIYLMAPVFIMFSSVILYCLINKISPQIAAMLSGAR